jgi:hypothetical protein
MVPRASANAEKARWDEKDAKSDTADSDDR